MASSTSISISKAERSFIQAGLLASSPSRADGRSLHDFRTVLLETGVAPLANGSARISLGKNISDGSGGTEIVAASKLEVESIDIGSESSNGGTGRVSCTVTCSPAAYPYLTSNALDDLQHDLTTLLHETLSHPSLHPKNLVILRGKKAWVLHLDLIVLADAGNVYDVLFMAARAALFDTKVPRTRGVEYKAPAGAGGSSKPGGQETKGDMEVDQEAMSGFDTRHIQAATDFELPDYWDEGEVLDGRDRWPVCITLNLLPPAHVLDATPMEESATPLRVLLFFSFDSIKPKSKEDDSSNLQGIRMLGNGELTSAQISELIKQGETYAREIFISLNAKLGEEDIRRNQKARQKFAQR